MIKFIKKNYWLIIAIIIVLLDQLTKYAILENLDVHKTISVIPGFFSLTYVQNYGIGLGLLADLGEFGKFLVITLTAIIIAVAAILLGKKKITHPLAIVALSFIIGGGIGNLIDRIFLRYVVDFLAFTIFKFDFWVFNVADVFVTVGTGLLIIYLIFCYKEPPVKEEHIDGSQEL